jgi:uncharacterized protein YkwD
MKNLITVGLLLAIMVCHALAAFTLTPTNIAAQLEQLRRAELKKLNQYRSMHGVPPVTLDNSLNTIAQKYAVKLNDKVFILSHSPEARLGKYGENLYVKMSTQYISYADGMATTSWYNEIAYYNFATGSSKSGKVTGHFTAEIWKTVKKVGFGFFGKYVSYMGKSWLQLYVVANYSPTPNVMGQYLQNVLKPKA